VHYPTDLNLLWDAMRCTVRTAASVADKSGLSGWRQHQQIFDKIIRPSFDQVRTSKLIR